MLFKASKAPVFNRGVPPDSFLNELVLWARSLSPAQDEEIFGLNPNIDIYSSVRPQLGPYKSLLHRKAVMLEALRVLGGFESSWNWTEGVDTNNPTSNTACTEEAGIFQCSGNSMSFDGSLKALTSAHFGMNDCETFIKGSKKDHAFALEYCARLLRFTINHHGPVKRKEINPYLDRDAVAEFMELLSEPEHVEGSTPPRPKSYDEVYKTFGNPELDSWQAANLAFCVLDSSLTAFPKKLNDRGFYCHKKLIPSFQAVFADICKAGLQSQIKTYDGCYNLRKISGSSRLSLHSWAIALDLNADDNSLGDTTPAMSHDVVNIFKKHGFFWGGDYTGRKDGMHFEYFDRS